MCVRVQEVFWNILVSCADAPLEGAVTLEFPEIVTLPPAPPAPAADALAGEVTVPPPPPPQPRLVCVTPGRGAGVLPAVAEGALVKLIDLLKMYVYREDRYPYCLR